MRINILLTIVLVAIFGRVSSQTSDSVKVVISHIFFCIDSLSYQNLFNHDFITDAFADCRELSNKTLTDSWTGKYLNGRQSYIEVFSVNDKKAQPELGDKFGDVGIVFRTKKPDDINIINERIKADKRDTHLELMKYETNGKTIPFNYNLYLSNVSLQEMFRPYVEEFTTDFLTLCGFNDSEIKAGITEEQFRGKKKRKKIRKTIRQYRKN